MGYSTDYEGYISIAPPVTDPQKLNDWLSQRHMVMNECRCEEIHQEDKDIYGPLKLVNDSNTIEYEGWNYIMPPQLQRNYIDSELILEHNTPPFECPSLWSDLEVNEDGTMLYWNGSEKTYEMEMWLKFLIKYVLKGHRLNGVLNWQGEYEGDIGTIIVKDNNVSIKE